jgi:uncharacterized radical SAM superfamily Fe-S cluster-containing enzyme
MTYENPLKTTTSVCPKCLTKVPATVFEKDGRVILRKTCPTHGLEEALLASDARWYWNAGRDEGCGSRGCCMTSNHSCTMIFEITDRCNLTCPTCFTASSPARDWQMSVDDFERKLDRLLRQGKADADMVQLSGGEPTIHPDLERMVKICFERGVRKVYINTNGIRLAKEPGLAERLAAIDGGQDRLQFYLQFDGREERTHELIRGARGLYPVKQQAIANIIAVGLFAIPVMTVTRGINLGEIGMVTELVLDHHPKMNTVMLQPAFYAGRYENEKVADRLTVAELVKEVAHQTKGLFLPEDFGPIPCSHPNCFALAVGLVREGKVIPVSRYFPRFEAWQEPEVSPSVARFANRMPQHVLDVRVVDGKVDVLLDLLAGLQLRQEDETVDALLDLLTGADDSVDWTDYKNFVVIGIKPFMDAHTYDQDRVDRCCVHVIDREGVPVSLCEYNSLRRPRGLV